MTLKLAIAGAAGRMGRELARLVHATDGCTLAGGLEAKGSPQVGADYGELIGAGKPNGHDTAEAAAWVALARAIMNLDEFVTRE